YEMRHLSFWVISLVLGVRLVFGATGSVARSGLGRFAAFGPPTRIFTENSERCQAALSAACPLECAWEI
ncbi:MAG: hypothetical protein ACPG4D_04195, partial [Alphaproteobacteria bacterium]